MRQAITIFALIIVWLTAVPAGAQFGDMQRLQTALEKTDQVLDRAREAVAQSGSERARNMLTIAMRLQTTAWERFQGNVVHFDLEVAAQIGKFTFGARQRAQQAIAITQQAEENEEYVRGRLEKTDDLIRRIRENVDADTPKGILLLLDSAREKQDRAAELFHNRRLRAALQLTLQTERTLEKATEELGSHLKAQRQYNSLLDRYLVLREQIELSGLADRPEVENRLTVAEQTRLQAEQLASESKFDKAEKQIQQAVEVLSRVSERLREPAKIQTALESLQRTAQELENKVATSGDAGLEKQYKTALDHMERAAGFFQDGDYDAAAAQLQAARQLLNRISQRLGE
jgi:hypothetical protein